MKLLTKKITAHNITQSTALWAALWLAVSPNRRTRRFNFLQLVEKEKDNLVMASSTLKENISEAVDLIFTLNGFYN